MVRVPWQCRPMLVGSLLSVLAGCGSAFDISLQSMKFNQELETVGNQQLLLNVVRSSKRYPLYFSSLTKVTGSDPIRGQSSIQIPFGGDAASNYVLTPQVNISSGSSFDFLPLDKEGFIRGINTEIKVSTLDFLLHQGWPPELLFMLMIERMEFPPEFVTDIDRRAKSRCAMSDPEHKDPRCDSVREDLAGPAYEIPKEELIAFLNNPDSRGSADLRKFQKMLRRLLVLGFKTTSDQAEIVKSRSVTTNGKKEITQIVAEKESKPRFCFGLRYQRSCDPEVSANEASKGKVPDTPENSSLLFSYPIAEETAEKRERLSAEIVIRSPASVLFYLGQTMRKGTPAVQLLTGPKTDRRTDILFNVLREQPARVAVRVEHEGETFYIARPDPEPDKGPKGIDRSMQVLSLVAQLISLQKSVEELPTSQSLTLIGQ